MGFETNALCGDGYALSGVEMGVSGGDGAQDDGLERALEWREDGGGGGGGSG